MNKGKVKFFNETKGFGFIVPAEGGDEVFVHNTGLMEDVKKDDQVTYETQAGKKGIVAVNVRLA